MSCRLCLHPAEEAALPERPVVAFLVSDSTGKAITLQNNERFRHHTGVFC